MDQQAQILAFDILRQAVDQPELDRESFVQGLCDGNQSLLDEVRALLRSHSRLGEFLSAPTMDGSEESPDSFPRGLADGATRLGRYRLTNLIGEGGFGSVYAAEQEYPVCRTVAVKIIKPGMDTKQVIARFQAERQTLAMMDHSNIARVFDAGSTELGRPYFVMELVHGVPITRYADEHRCTIRARLELFVQVCHAVQHAHTKGIIHRDLKPSNVLVAEMDGDAILKVIDFGISKAINGDASGGTLLTQQAQLLGTPQYMSPEQADGGSDVDTRSDIYSLGVMLYELLVGTTPLESRNPRPQSLAEIQRAVREAEPRKPSACIASDPQAASIAMNRGTTTNRLRVLMRRELDWIVLKALEKDRGRRYETAAALAADVQRYLRSEPVSARPATAVYRARVLVRRNRLAVTSLAAILLVLLSASAVSIWALLGQVKAASTARHAFDDANAARHQALIQVAEGMTLQADAWVAARRWPEAEALYAQAQAECQRLGAPSYHNRLGQWNLARLAPPPVETWKDVTGHVHCVAVSPDGRRAVYVDEGCNVVTRDLLSGRILSSWKFPGSFCHSVCFSPDGTRLVFDDGNDQLCIWDANTHKPLVVLERAVRPSPHPVFSPDGRLVAAGDVEGHFQVWDANNGGLLWQREKGNGRAIVGVAFSPDTRRLAVVGHQDHSLCVWDLETRRPAWRAVSDAADPTHVAYAPDGTLIATCGYTGVVELWDAATGDRLATSGTPGLQLNGVAFSPDGTLLLAGYEKTPRLWDVRPYAKRLRASAPKAPLTMREFCCFRGNGRPITSIAFTPDGKRAVSSTADGTVSVWPVPREGAPLGIGLPPSLVLPEQRAWHAHDNGLDGTLAFSPDGRLLLSGAWDGWLKIWDARTGRLLKVLGRHKADWAGVGSGARFTPGGRFVVSGGWDHTVKIWDVLGPPNQKGLTLMTHGGRVRAIALSPDGRSVVSVGEDELVQTCDLPVIAPTAPLPTAYTSAVRVLARGVRATSPSGVYRIHFCSWPDRPLVVCTRELDPPLVFEWPGGKRVAIHGNPQPLGMAEPWPGHPWLVTTAADNRIHFWPREALRAEAGIPTPTGSVPELVTPAFSLGPHGAVVQNVAFDPTGAYVISSGGENSLKFWDLATHRLLAEPGGINGRSTILSPDGSRLAGDGYADKRAGIIVVSDLSAPTRQDELQRLAEAARTSLRLHPDDPRAWIDLGNWYSSRGVCDWAVECFDRARRLQRPDRPDDRGVPSLVFANCLWDAGRLADAKREFARLLASSSDPPQRLHLALCAEALNDSLFEIAP